MPAHLVTALAQKPPFNSARRTEGPILIDEVEVQKLQKIGEVLTEQGRNSLEYCKP
jgi:hypothetical protein